MPVIDTDIIVHGSAAMQETDSGTQGGAIDLSTVVIFTDMSTTDAIDVVSSAAGDTTQTLTITGRIADGSITTEDFVLTGATPVVGSTNFERILKMVLDGTCAGTVTVEEQTANTDLVVIPIGVTTVRRPFYNVSADASGGSARNFYEKIFFYNSNASSALTSATIAEVAGGVASNIDFDLEDALDDNNTSTTRIVAPAGQTFDSATKNVVNSQNHSTTSGQGVWLRLALAAGASANNSTYTLRESGQTV
jgi:hypothetical protein